MSTKGGEKRPFPTQDWADGPETGSVGLTSVLGIHSDSKGVVWMLDMGGKSTPAQLVGWDTNSNTLEKVIKIPRQVLADNSFIQDFVVDEKREKVYIADMSFGNFEGATKPAIIIVDMNSEQSRRVLEGNAAFIAPDKDIVIEGSLLASKSPSGETNPLRFGLNPIATDENFEWVYFATMNGELIYRIPASQLADEQASDATMAEKIAPFGPKKASDGMLYIAGKGIAVTDLANNAVGLSSEGRYQVLIKDKRLSWPDSMAYHDGYIYVTADQLHKHPAFSQGRGGAKPPYRLMRFKLD
ncbi:L-dopachrome tautomerase-related protein [Alteromonas profundi]|uniref:L-dopachrome tautomerase-related protein n=1 Tax=Alteromonas profundi TaxID=2696062 RepID=UPI0019425C11